jgi:hypothetical protein
MNTEVEVKVEIGGIVDNFIVWNHVLSPIEITKVYETGMKPFASLISVMFAEEVEHRANLGW